HMRSVINDIAQKMGMQLTADGQLARTPNGQLTETDRTQVQRFNQECLRAFQSGQMPFLLQMRDMTPDERQAADNAQGADSPLRGTYHRALEIFQPAPRGDR